MAFSRFATLLFMILDAKGRPIPSTTPQTLSNPDPREPNRLSRKPTPVTSEFAKRLTQARTQLDQIRIGVWLARPNGGSRKLHQIAPALMADFCAMILREKLEFKSCFVQVRDKIGEVYSQWRQHAEFTAMADADFRKRLKKEGATT